MLTGGEYAPADRPGRVIRFFLNPAFIPAALLVGWGSLALLDVLAKLELRYASDVYGEGFAPWGMAVAFLMRFALAFARFRTIRPM